MSLKRLYKQMVPMRVRERVAGHPWVQHLRNRQLVREGWRLAAAARAARGADGRIHVAFLVQRPALWVNHASIYEALRNDPAFDVAVIAIPKRPPAAAEPDLEEYRRLMAFLDAKGIAHEPGYDLAAGAWVNPLAYGLPDVVFLPQPYAFTQSYLYGSDYWRRFCRIAYVTYGAILSMAMTKVLCKSPFFNHCKWVFLENEDIKEYFQQMNPGIAGRVIAIGQPKTDAYRKFTTTDGLWKLRKASKRIVWAPHFTVSREKTPHAFSKFFEYFDAFIGLAEAHPDIEFVLRPHPELFEHMVATGLKTRTEAEEYRRRFNALPNGQVYEGGDIFEMFKESDALILDSIGFLLEYLPTGKPVCFIGHSRRQPLNKAGEALLAVYYHAGNPSEIKEFIDNVVICGNDNMQTVRLAAREKYIRVPDIGVGHDIKEILKLDCSDH